MQSKFKLTTCALAIFLMICLTCLCMTWTVRAESAEHHTDIHEESTVAHSADHFDQEEHQLVAHWEHVHAESDHEQA